MREISASAVSSVVLRIAGVSPALSIVPCQR
jgi:hypothetical protein